MIANIENRQEEILQFIKEYFATDQVTLTKMIGDAGARNYYRFQISGTSIPFSRLNVTRREKPKPIIIGERRATMLDLKIDLFENSFMVEDLKKKRSAEPQRTFVREDSSTELTYKSSAEMSFRRGLMGTGIIMDALYDANSLENFIAIAQFLRSIDLSAPQIYHSSLEKKLLMLEDFGSTSFKQKLLESNEEQKSSAEISFERALLYKLSIDLLIALQQHKAPSFIAEMNDQDLLLELEIFINYYIPYKYHRELTDLEKTELRSIWSDIISQQIPMTKVLSLQDYHTENLMMLDDRLTIQSFGILDFQDAKLASPIYDVVSILEDARIQVDGNLAINMLQYYTENCRYDFEDVYLNYHILGMQRNSRILGVFSKKYIVEQEKGYLQYIPFVEKYLEGNLSHPVMKQLKKWLMNL